MDTPTNKRQLLRWGLLSTARINRSLIPVLNTSQRNQLVAVASRSMDNARRYSLQWQIPRYYGSYEGLLDDPEIDVVYISLPNQYHCEWTIKAAEAGKHVLCEKPLALAVEEVDAMISAAERAGVFVSEAFMYRHHPQTLEVKEIVGSGGIGELIMMNGSFSFPLNRPNDVRLDPALGGGSLWDVGCYPISYFRYIAGAEPVEVFGREKQGSTGVDLFFAGLLRFSPGLLSDFDCGFQGPLRSKIEIVGTKGKIEVPNPFKPGLHEALTIFRENGAETVEIKGEDLYRGEVEEVADVVLEGKPPRISLLESRGNVATIEALLGSARTGNPVRLDL